MTEKLKQELDKYIDEHFTVDFGVDYPDPDDRHYVLSKPDLKALAKYFYKLEKNAK